MSKYNGFDLDVRNLKINGALLNMKDDSYPGTITCVMPTIYCQTMDDCTGTVSNVNVIGKTV